VSDGLLEALELQARQRLSIHRLMGDIPNCHRTSSLPAAGYHIAPAAPAAPAVPAVPAASEAGYHLAPTYAEDGIVSEARHAYIH
jgi:hypothetical protein